MQDKNFKMVAKTLFGFEDILAKELRDLGALNVETAIRSVYFEGDTGFMYKANLCLRTATKIIKPIATFKATMAIFIVMAIATALALFYIFH